MSGVRAEAFAVVVTLACPTCGSDGYEVDLTASEINAGTQVEIPCDDCSARFVVDVDVRIQALTTRSEPLADSAR